MADEYADEFAEIPGTLAKNASLRAEMLDLIESQAMVGKVTEGGTRLDSFRKILQALANGHISVQEACRRTEVELPRQSSIHAGNNHVFAEGWAERQLRTQFSRFYNQAVMERLLAQGETRCFVPHSSAEAPDSACSQKLAGTNQDLQRLYDLLVQSYGAGNWSHEDKIPNHPHCTHVVTPPR